jgi:hypothetical protein
MKVTFTTSDLSGLTARLAEVGGLAAAEVRPVVAKGALNIKQDWAQRWSGFAHAPAVGKAVTYDMSWPIGGAEAEIGPDKGRRQGALGNLLEYGSIHNGPIPGGAPALEAEEPKFTKAIEDLGSKLLEGL